METVERTQRIRSRLLEIFRRETDLLWPEPELMSKSAILADLHAEWSIHYIATLETLNSGVLEIEKWYNEPANKTDFADKLTDLPLTYLERSCEIFEQNNIEKYIELLSAIAESAAKISGIQGIIDAFELVNAFRNAWNAAGVRHAEAKATDGFLFVVEELMKRMLLGALMVETQAGSLTGRFLNYEPVDAKLKAEWRKPIEDRIISARDELTRSGGGTKYLVLPAIGMWPSGL